MNEVKVALESTVSEKTAEEKVKEYQAAWNKANTKMVHCKMNCKTDADILAYLEHQGNVAGLIKSLLRAKMKQDGFVYREG